MPLRHCAWPIVYSNVYSVCFAFLDCGDMSPYTLQKEKKRIFIEETCEKEKQILPFHRVLGRVTVRMYPVSVDLTN